MPRRPARKCKLTELGVRKLQPEPAPYLVWDLHVRGLALRVWPTGRMSWYVVYSFAGRPRWLYLGDASHIGLADARRLAATAMLAVATGKDPAAERKAERGAGTFAELAMSYVERYSKKHNKSWQQGDRLITRYVLPRWGKLQATAIGRADVKALRDRIAAPILANQILHAISAVFSWAVREDIVPVNPCTKVEHNATKSRDRVLGESELPRFWNALAEVEPTAAAALKALLLVGQRPGEIICMRHEHIVDGWWEMPGEPVPELGWPGTKNKRGHRVWLPAPVREIIAAGEGFVFGNGKVRLDGVMRDICSRLEIARTTPHDLRRTHGSAITSLGFGRDAMNRVQNHIEGGIADVYDRHRYEQENKQVMEATAAKLLALATGESDAKVVPIRGR
jgi:integrase